MGSLYLNGNHGLPTKNWTCQWDANMLNEMKLCNDDLLHFAENYFYIINVDEGKQKITLYDCQKRVLNSFLENRRVSVVASRQIGKALDIDTPIPTPDGFKSNGELVKGDVVLGSNGLPCNVTHAHDVMYDRECYELVFDNGDRIITDADHNWYTQSRTERKRHCIGSVKTTKEILNTLTCGRKVVEPMHRIKISSPINYPERELALHPYVLGVWLGDGSSGCARIHCDVNDKEELKTHILNSGINITDTGDDRCYIGLIGDKKWSSDCPTKALRKLNVLNNKHIPQEYLFSSIEQRRELLRGLMDTDGFINKGGVCQFYSSNIILHENVKQLVSSLGVKWSSTSKFPKIKDKVYDEHFILTFTPTFECFKFERKKTRQRLEIKSDRSTFLYIKEVNPVKSRPVRCITVDSEDSLFLAGHSYIPTHNSTMLTIFALWLASFNKDQNIFILANKEETAKMLLDRVRMAYEEMPNWIKPPIKELNKTALVFENGSAIRTSTTSSQGIRGQAVSCVDGSSVVTIRDKDNGNVFDISTKELAEILERDGEILSYKIVEEDD